MNERSATISGYGAKAGSAPRRTSGAERRVEALEHRDPPSARNAGSQLPVADVDGVHVGGAALEQAVDEAAGRRTGVERRAGRDGHGEAVEGGVELLAAAAHEGRGGPEEDEWVGGRHESRRLGGGGARRRGRARGEAACAACLVVTRPRRTSSVSSRRRAPRGQGRPSGGFCPVGRAGPTSGVPAAAGRTLARAARARLAAVPACPALGRPSALVRTRLAVLPAWVRPLGRLARLAAPSLGGPVGAAWDLAGLRGTSRVVLRPASADCFRTSATWSASCSRDVRSTPLELRRHLGPDQVQEPAPC